MYSINAIGKFISNFRDFYNEINTATLTGAIDIVVVEQPDGSFTCSPFHVRFGKLGVLRSREKVVDIEINGEAQDIHMKLGESGEAFFVEEVPLGFEDEYIPPHLACSPIPQDYFPSHFQDKSKATVTEILEDVQTVVQENINEKHDVQEETFMIDDISGHQDECLTDTAVATPISSEVYIDGSSTNQLVAKTFRAETVDENKETAEKVRKISIVTGEFRPISLEIDLSDNKNVSGAVEEDDANADVQSTSLSRKGSYKDCLGPVEDYQKPSSSCSRRKKRKKSLKKKNGQKKGSGSSSSQTEQSEQSETGRDSKEQSEPVEQGNQNESQVTCSHLGGVIINNNTSTVFSSANCETCRKTPANPTVTISNVDFQSSSCELLKAAANNLVELSRMQNASTETDFHFFSDTEITPGCSPNDSRPSSPVQSDTEFEMNRQSKSVSTEAEDGQTGLGVMQQSWRWGELPTLPRNVSAQSLRGAIKEKTEPEAISSSDEEVQKQQQEAAEAAQRSMLSGMFSFMKKTKRIRHNPESEGIYLSDLNSDELDPEVAALYFPTSYKQGQNVTLQATQGPSQRHRDEEDAESGNGTSLPQSPNSVEGAICGPKSLDSDFEEPKHSIFEQKSYGEISMSLCGGLADSGPSEDNFLQHLVSHNDLVRDPKLIENPNLVVRLNGKYYNWRTAGPLIMSLVIFQKPLPQNVIDTLSTDYMPLKKVQKKDVKQSGYSSWFYWRRPSEPKKMNAGPVCMEDLPIANQDKFTILKEVVPVSSVEVQISTEAKTSTFQNSAIESDASKPVDIPKPSGFDNHKSDSKRTEGDESEMMQNSLPKPNSKDSKEEGYSGSNSSDESDGGRRKPQNIKKPLEKRSYYDHPEKYRKTLRLSSDQIASLNLNEGANEVVFSVTTAYQGTTRCKCHIYRWRFDDKIVISDIDGTITKSDVLGHILPIVGKDWAQSGVAQLFTKIKNNGYKLLYLSARAIGQARVTREYLRSIKQGDLCLPEGPLLLNPTSLISAFHREVIEKKPEEFKISCLRDIQALFPENSKPFYAGYGNRINDVWAYRAVGIPIFRIFTINHKGELKHELTQTFQSSYSNMSYIVDQMFPPPPEDTAEDFSNFIYWRDPIQEIELDPSVVMITPVSDMATDVNRKKSVTVSSGH